jgi:hypothetical protein
MFDSVGVISRRAAFRKRVGPKPNKNLDLLPAEVCFEKINVGGFALGYQVATSKMICKRRPWWRGTGVEKK